MSSDRLARVAAPVLVVVVIVMMVVPIPAMLLDVLLAANIAAALLVLLVAMQVRKPLDFAVFPTVVLVATILRLALNVSTTRLVLRDGYAGEVVEAFGHIVIGGSLVIGLVVFAILVVIQLTVITNGAARVAEVGARFTLDAMPGKQMAIDADLNAGLIDESEARRRRTEIAAEADFYGAMDGGTKFVKGDAMASIIITLVNLIGGFTIGMVQQGLGAAESIEKYSLLSVGDGLVSQIPALMMSVATGIIVTRSTGSGDLGNDVRAQIAAQPEALRIGGAALLVLCLVPGMPWLPFLVVGAALLAASFLAGRQSPPTTADAAPPGQPAQAPGAAAPATPRTEQVTESLKVDQLELLLAPDLVDLVDVAQGGDLLDRIKALRRKTALDLGIVLPPVRTRDGALLAPSTYEIKVAGVTVGGGEAPPGHVLAIGDAPEMLPGKRTTEPVFGLPAVWVPLEHRTTAEMVGATIVERAAVLTTHLAEMVRRHASRLLSLDDVRELLDVLKGERPAAVEELVPGLLPLSSVQRVLQALLDEQVSIRDLGRVLEGVGQRARSSTDPDHLLEAARAALGPALAAPYLDRSGTLHAITLDADVEQVCAEALRAGELGAVLALDPGLAAGLVQELTDLVTTAESTGRSPVLLAAGPLRLPLRRLLRGSLPQLPVIGFAETAGVTTIDSIGQVSRGHEFAA